MENEIQKSESVSPLAAAAELVSANGNMDVEKLGKLLEMEERWNATQAKKAYVSAMSEFKKNPPTILKDKHVSYPTKTGGNTDYNHATLGNVTACVNKALSEHGLTASWVTGQEGSSVKVTCKITHIAGHSEETYLFSPPDASGGKNAIQAIGSVVTYLQRYTLLALTGLATYEQDDDGAGATDKGKPKIPQPTEAEQKVIDAITAKLQEDADGKTVSAKKVAAVLYGQKSRYPADMAKVGTIANLLVTQGSIDSLCESDDPFPFHCNDCSMDFAEPKGGKCPNCESDGYIDRGVF